MNFVSGTRTLLQQKQNLEKTRLRAESCISKRVVMRDSKGSGNVVLEVVKCNDERNSSRF